MKYLVDNYDTFRDLYNRLDVPKSRWIALDTETNGLRPYHGDKMIGFSVWFPDENLGFYVPYRHENSPNVSDLQWMMLKEVLIQPQHLYVLFNAKFDLHFLAQEGFGTPEYAEEVMVAARLLNENEELSNGNRRDGAYQLKRLAGKYLGGWAVQDEKALYDAGKALGINSKGQMAKLPADIVAPYAVTDTQITWELREFYRPHLERWQQWDLYLERSQFQLKCLFRMEQNGISVDTEQIHKTIEALQPEVEAERLAFDIAAKELGLNIEGGFNPNSPQQLLAFFNMRGHNITSTAKLVLDKIAYKDEYAKRLLEYRVKHKARSTYYDPYLNIVSSDGKIRTNFNVMGTVTGRLSSNNPNLQQIPREGYDDAGGQSHSVKQVFVPSKGYTLVQMDYKQLELRIAVNYAQEETMRRMINNGDDMHTYTAESLGITRHQGKTANFSFLYGMGAETGSIRLKTDENTARSIIRGWHDLFPNFKRALASASHLAAKRREPDGTEPGQYQYIRLPNDRIRHYNEYSDFGIEPPFFGAWNFMVQGTAGIVTDAGITRACSMYNNDILRPLIQVHDSFIFEVRDDQVGAVVPTVVKLMEDERYNPALRVDTKTSKISWADAS